MVAVDKEWTLFLDRDGVINKKLDGDYIKHIHEFEFEPGVLDLFPRFHEKFGRIIVVTNQQGIGKKLMTEKDLHDIHEHMKNSIEAEGGRIDEMYFAPQRKLENSIMRKPGVGMPLKASKDFPDINFSKSIMIGDSATDIEMGKTLGMTTIFLHHGDSEKDDNINADHSVFNLNEVTKIIEL